MRGSYSEYGLRDTINWLGPYPSSPVSEPAMFKDIPAPTQCDSSIDEYFEMIKTYETGGRFDNEILHESKKYGKLAGYNEEHLKHQFLRGLDSENQVEARICGLDLSLEELIGRLSIIKDTVN